MRKLVILGSTGSIGKQTINVTKKYPERFKIVGLSTNKNIQLIEKQIEELNPLVVAVGDLTAAQKLKEKFSTEKVEILAGEDGLIFLSQLAEADIVVNALVGSIGLRPTLKALESGKTLCLANKESLVVGGELVTKLVENKESCLIPVDSEHSAIFQCLQGENLQKVRKIIITGSGGPFRRRKPRDLRNITVSQALAHPRWKMGRKITIDSATLMNKGLEVIEAHYLFKVTYEQIKVVIHPESIIHSLVEFEDGSIKAQLGPTDMRLPIQYALTYPERLPSPVSSVDLVSWGSLHFEEPDLSTFPCLKYAYEAGKAGKTYPAVLNAANEEAVAAFLAEKIGFLDIPAIVYSCLEAHKQSGAVSLDTLQEAEKWARLKAQQFIEKRGR